MIARLVTLTLLLAATPAAAQGRGNWVVRQADQSCKLTAAVRGGRTVELSRTGTIPKIAIEISPDPLPPGAAFGTPIVRISGINAWHILNDKNAPAIMIVIDEGEFASLLAPGILTVSVPGRDTAIPIPSGSAARRDLDTCLARLRRAGRDPGKPAVTPPRPLPERPLQGVVGRVSVDGLAHFDGGSMSLILAIGPDGRPLGCTVVEAIGRQLPSGGDICRAMIAYARFSPALDKAGKPTIGDYPAKLRWDAL